MTNRGVACASTKVGKNTRHPGLDPPEAVLRTIRDNLDELFLDFGVDVPTNGQFFSRLNLSCRNEAEVVIAASINKDLHGHVGRTAASGVPQYVAFLPCVDVDR